MSPLVFDRAGYAGADTTVTFDRSASGTVTVTVRRRIGGRLVSLEGSVLEAADAEALVAWLQEPTT